MVICSKFRLLLHSDTRSRISRFKPECETISLQVQRLVHENQRLQSMNPLQRQQEVGIPMISPQQSPQRRPMSMIEARDQRQQAAHRSKVHLKM